MFSATKSPKTPPLSENADDESIHTDSDAEDKFVRASQLLQQKKEGKPVPDNADELILSALQMTHKAGTQYKRQGRQWQKIADQAGADFEVTSEQLERVKKQHQKVNTENANLKKAKQQAEQGQSQAEWREKQIREAHDQLSHKLAERTRELERMQNQLKATQAEVIEDAEIKAAMAQFNLSSQEIDQLNVLSRSLQLHLGLSDEEMTSITDEELKERAKGIKLPALLTEQ
jgi:hypothetical protein